MNSGPQPELPLCSIVLALLAELDGRTEPKLPDQLREWARLGVSPDRMAVEINGRLVEAADRCGLPRRTFSGMTMSRWIKHYHLRSES